MKAGYRPGAIYHMLAGGEVEYDGETKSGPPETVDVPEELGGGERRPVTARVLVDGCPKCGDKTAKPALVLEGGLIWSECLACQSFLWLAGPGYAANRGGLAGLADDAPAGGHF